MTRRRWRCASAVVRASARLLPGGRQSVKYDGVHHDKQKAIATHTADRTRISLSVFCTRLVHVPSMQRLALGLRAPCVRRRACVGIYRRGAAPASAPRERAFTPIPRHDRQFAGRSSDMIRQDRTMQWTLLYSIDILSTMLVTLALCGARLPVSPATSRLPPHEAGHYRSRAWLFPSRYQTRHVSPALQISSFCR